MISNVVFRLSPSLGRCTPTEPEPLLHNGTDDQQVVISFSRFAWLVVGESPVVVVVVLCLPPRGEPVPLIFCRLIELHSSGRPRTKRGWM